MFVVSWQWFYFSDQVPSYAQSNTGQAFEQAVYKYAVCGKKFWQDWHDIY